MDRSRISSTGQADCSLASAQEVWSCSSSLDVIIAETVFHEAKKTSSFTNEIYLPEKLKESLKI